ncbi:MAG: PrsW family intramembrane metalloprotease [Bacteroidales bacterium]|nr:PrsW family intramembrane metalloprotease [Bacteroidales bacterium]
MLLKLFMYLFLLGVSIAPAILLMFFIYFKDKYQKEPFGSLVKAYFTGMLAIVSTMLMVTITDYTIGLIPYLNETVFYDSFITAGIPEEVSKFLVFMVFIWNDKNFDEYFDGIVYASFISLGFATVENIMYVLPSGLGVGIMRAVLSVPGHFFFGIILGYFLSLAKFNKSKRGLYIFLGLLFAILAHGLFDWLLMFSERAGEVLGIFIYQLFIAGDIFLWRLGLRLIKKHQENSLAQAQQFDGNVTDMQ